MTALEAFEQFIEVAKVKTVKSEVGGLIQFVITDDEPRWAGYAGFAQWFEFDTDGKLIHIGADE